MKQQSTTLLNTAMDPRLGYIHSEILVDNNTYQESFRLINKALEGLPNDRVDLIDGAYCTQISVIQEVMYRQGFQDGINLLLEMMQGRLGKAKYMFLECESKRKDVRKSGRSGYVYKITRVIREYANEQQAEKDLSRLKAGEISESDLFGRKTKV